MIDTGSPYIIFSESIAPGLGLRPPFRRHVLSSTLGGSPLPITFPDDGDVRLLLSDFIRGYCMWAPPVGFVSDQFLRARNAHALLGFTGFMQILDVFFRTGTTPAIEITIPPSFPGVAGAGRPGTSGP